MFYPGLEFGGGGGCTIGGKRNVTKLIALSGHSHVLGIFSLKGGS